MSFAFEHDELRRELRAEVADVLSVWPKLPGAGNVQVTGTPTFEVRDPGGVLLQSGSASASLVGDIHRIDVSVAAISTLAEDYQLRVTWTASGETVARLAVEYFDVVLHPFGLPSVSLNDLLEVRPEVDDVLDRLGARLNRTKEQLASIYAVRALVDLDSMIRDQVSRDEEIRPHLIVNRHRLNTTERMLALKHVYRADSNNPEEGEDESSALYRHFRDEAKTAWATVGPLKYETPAAEDLVPDAVARDLGRSVRLRRTPG